MENQEGSTITIIIVLIVGVIIGVLGTIVFVKYALYDKVSPFLEPLNDKLEHAGEVIKTTTQAEEEDNPELCEEIEDVDEKQYCYDSVYTKRAETTGNMKFCEDNVSEKRKDPCYVAVAKKMNDENACYKIVDNIQKQSCLDSILKYKSVEQNNLDLCLQTTGSALSYCVDKLTSDKLHEDYCDQIPKEVQQECLDNVLTNKAVVMQDIEICEQIEDRTDAGSCRQNYYTPNDKDEDFLNDLAEQYYKTDSDKPDSDADGYKDGDEVVNGYNPLGAGKLDEVTK